MFGNEMSADSRSQIELLLLQCFRRALLTQQDVQIKLASLILKEAECNWCKERLGLYLMIPCIRDPLGLSPA